MLNLSQTNKTNLPLLYDEVLEKGYKKSFQEFINEVLELVADEIKIKEGELVIEKTAQNSLVEYIEKLEQFRKKTKIAVTEDEQFKTLQEALAILGYNCKDWGEFYSQIENVNINAKRSPIQ